MIDKNVWRLLDYSSPDPCMNLAVEEAILRGRLEGGSPNTLRLWQHPPVVSVGCLQDPKVEVDIELCKRLGIAVIRRVSAGGAMYIDEGSLQCSLVSDDKLSPILQDINESYRFFSNGVIDGLRLLGVNAEFRPVNDVTVNNRKISGSAQHRLYNIIIHHSTISVDVDLQILEKVLKVPESKLRSKGFSSIRASVTSIRDELGKDIPIDSVKKALVHGFEKTLGVKFKKGRLTYWEMKLARELYEKKYSTSQWIYDITKPPLQVSSIYRASKGVIRVSMSFHGQTIEKIHISGDFFIHPENAVKELEQSLKGGVLSKEWLEKRIREFFAVKNIKALGVTPEDFARAILTACSDRLSSNI